MNKPKIIKQIKALLREKTAGEGTGHDWYHLERVLKVSNYIAAKEKSADIFVVDLIALLHDLEDWKFSSKKDAHNLPRTQKLLRSFKFSDEVISKIIRNIQNISFKGTGKNVPPDLEGKIVQDADRLEALGALGVARAFAYGGKMGRQIYDPKLKPGSLPGTSLNHFYEKLLLLKNKMNTKTGRRLATSRHKFLEKYLQQFYNEWESEF